MVTRPLAAIVAAILLSQPRMAPSTAKSYAQVVQSESRSRHIDPFTLVAIAHYESRWLTGASNGACMGLAGVCASNYPCCQKDPSGACCRARKACLLDGRCNLREAARAITANRNFCRKKTGNAQYRHWLASYQGLNVPSRDVWCGQKLVKGRWRDVPVHELTRRVMARRRYLIRRCSR